MSNGDLSLANLTGLVNKDFTSGELTGGLIGGTIDGITVQRRLLQPTQRSRKDVADTVHYRLGLQDPDDPLEFIMSDDSVDRMGDIIDPKGWDLKDFKRNSMALFNHNKNAIIGQWENVRVSQNKLMGHLKLARSGTSRLVDEIRALVEQKILKASSVGFIPREFEERLDKKGAWAGGYIFRKCELLETSLVSIPANANALSTAKQMGISNGTLETVFGKNAVDDYDPDRLDKSVRSTTTRASKTSRIHADKPVSSKRIAPMRLGERIETAEARLVAIKDDISDIMKGAEDDDNRSLLDDERVQISEYEEEAAGLEKDLAAYKSAEKVLMQKSATTELVRKAGTIPASAKNDKPGDIIVKAAVCQFLAHVRKQNPVEIARSVYRDDARMEAVVRSAVDSATTTAVGWAAELVQTDIRGFMETLRPVSVYGRLAALGTSIDFGNAASITIPNRAGGVSGTDLAGSFVGENRPIPVKKTAFGASVLNRYKMAVISSFSAELAEQSTPSIEALIRRGMTDDTAVAIDNALLDGSAGVAGLRPPSILNGVVGIPSAGVDPADIVTDLRAAFEVLSDQNAGRTPVLIMNPSRAMGLALVTSAAGTFLFRDEVGQGRLLGVPIVSSTNVPADIVILMDAADFATAAGAPNFNVSDQATLVMLNDDGVAPTMNMTTGTVRVDQAAAVGGGPAHVHSLFQQNSIAIRMIMPLSWAMMRTGVIAEITGVAW